MSYDEEQQRKSRVVVQTPTSRREVVRTETERYPERSGGVSTGVVATVAIAAIALTAIIVYFLMNSNNAANDNTNVRVTSAQPTPVQQQPVIIQQPAPQQQQPPVVIQQPATAPPQTIVVPGPSTSTSTSTTTTGATAPKPNVPDDMAIQTNIDDKLSKDRTFSTLGITATVINGKVTLLGTVETPELKRQAESLVRNVKGVQRVDNQITVSGGTE
jgi:cytoskeletal protein RodZ